MPKKCECDFTAMDYIRRELHHHYRRYVYFCWKNNVKNQVGNDYSNITENEFIKRYCKDVKNTTISMQNLKEWENSLQYNFLKKLLLYENMNKDLYKIVDKVREKALQGDNTSVRTFIALKKELKNNIDVVKELKYKNLNSKKAKQ